MSITNKDLWVDPAAAEREGTKMFGHFLLAAIFIVAAAFLFWSHWAILDVITRGEAKVVPSSQTQVIQSLDGGILEDMKVRDGELVEKGQPILIIRNDTAVASLAELTQRYYIAAAAVARLKAEIAGVQAPEEIPFPEDVVEKAPEKIEAEKAQFTVRFAQLRSQQATLNDEVNQREQQVRAIDTKIKSARSLIGTAQKRLENLIKLRAAGGAGENEVLEAQQQVQQFQADIENAQAERPGAVAALEAAKSKKDEAVATYRAQSAQELAKHQSDLATVRESMKDAGAKVRRTEVKSPVKGTVKDIKIRTIGGVIQPAQDIMEIVPIEDNLLIEAQIRPQDRGFIAPGQPAKVKITAYDFSIYGGLDGVVEDISADAIENEKKELYFRVRIRTDKSFLVGKEGENLPIIPGMTASVDILTGKKTVLEYLLKPILKAKEQALTER
ncbi:adhesin transport system membrane fusion protein [Dongia mobilis]|uniref:Membrane fusion protein (MFP) family protein n=1 Tax=Dongia mobilis TaxID=578943 RepID=A0A4R6WQ51_9PROT|nr:HlyD family type I secretion periplasmic adaptor subunit [Dongia mobilis]TDQ81314.1 adhesin transport system membrane fusion protein [Dongia mobilis]